MAILNGIISKLNGSAGNLTFVQKNGQTVMSEKITKTTDAKTEAQQKHRMRWANIIHLYQVLQPYMKLAFGGQDYNKFVSRNVGNTPVYLTKQEVNNGAGVITPYQITQGKVPSISVTGKGKLAVTNIALGSLAINADTTVAQFSNAVVQNNRVFEYGDQITYILLSQVMNDVTATPIVEIEACCIVLDKGNEAKLLSLVLQTGFAVSDGKLAAQSDHDFGNHGMVWIHSRKVSGETRVSTQYIVVENALLTTYQSDEAYQSAAASYGGANEVYLSPSGILKTTADSDSDSDAAAESGSQFSSGNETSGGTTSGGTTSSGTEGGSMSLGE